MSDERCEATSWAGFFGCRNKGKVFAGGQWWCGIHDPAAVARRSAARTEAANAELAALRERLEEMVADVVYWRAAVLEDPVSEDAWDALMGEDGAIVKLERIRLRQPERHDDGTHEPEASE